MEAMTLHMLRQGSDLDIANLYKGIPVTHFQMEINPFVSYTELDTAFLKNLNVQYTATPRDARKKLILWNSYHFSHKRPFTATKTITI